MAYTSDDNDKIDAPIKEKEDNMARFKAIDPRVHELCNFDFKVMKDYPHKIRDNDLPIVACKRKNIAEFDQI